MSRRWLRPALLPVVLAVVAVTGTAPMDAAADTHDQMVAAKARLSALNERAEMYAEKMNAARDRLAEARTRAAIADRAATAATRRLDASREAVAEFAAQAYRSGSLGQTGLFTPGVSTPEDFLDKLTLLDAVSRNQAGVLADFAALRHSAAQATETARAARARARATVAEITRARQTILRDAAEVESLLRQLHRKAEAEAAARAAQALTAQPTLSPPAVNTSGTAHAAAVALEVAKQQLGKPYVWGAAGPDSFDCSGLTMYAYGRAGIALPHYTGAQWNVGRHVDRSELQPGDLVFYYSDLHHMGMYVGNGQVIHAPHTGDVVRIAPLDLGPYMGAVRVVG